MSPKSTLCKFAILWLLLPGLVAPMRLAAQGGFLPHSRKAFRGTPAGPSYILSESFDPTGYDTAFTEAGSGTVDEDYTATSIHGVTQCLRILGSTQTPRAISPTWSNTGATHFYFLVRPISFPPSTAIQFFRVLKSTTLVASISFNTNGTLRATANGGSIQTTANAMTAGTTYHCYVTYTPGTGSPGSSTDASITLGFSTDGTKPTSGGSYQESTNGTATDASDGVSFGNNSSNTYEALYDNFVVSSVAITSPPTFP